MSTQELDLIILKHILTSKKNALEFVHSNSEKIFSADVWRFSKIVLDYIRTYKELPTRKVINERLKDAKNEQLVKYINQLWDSIDEVNVTEIEYKHDLEKIKNRFTEKLIYDLKERLVGEDGRINLTKSISELTTTANHIKGLNQVKAYEQKTLKESINDFEARYIAKMNNANYGAGLKTGINFFDLLTGGIRPGELVVCLGATGGGKSIMLNHCAVSLWLGENTIDMTENFKEGSDVVYFSLEMPYADCLERLISRLALVPQVAIRDAILNDEQKNKVSKVLKFIKNYPYELTIVDVPRNASPEGIELIYNDIVSLKGKKPKVVIIDYLALMEYNDPNMDDWLKQGKLAEAVSELARVNNINVITAAQLNSDNKKGKGGEIGTHRISRSKLIGHNANFILMIEPRPNEAERPDLAVHLIKSRRTQLGQGTMFKKLDCCAFMNESPISSMSSSLEDISDIIE